MTLGDFLVITILFWLLLSYGLLIDDAQGNPDLYRK